jgi:glucose-6-phosphate isomerase
MFGFWDWVGGRYSMDSAVGPSTMIAIGRENFRAFPDGFRQMVGHFRTAPFEANLPLIMGLLSLWYNDFFGAQTVAVLPFEQSLKRFPAFLQKLTMESKGKHATINGEQVAHDAGPIYRGERGTNRRHASCQSIHQGTQRILPELESRTELRLGHESLTNSLIRLYRKRKKTSFLLIVLRNLHTSHPVTMAARSRRECAGSMVTIPVTRGSLPLSSGRVLDRNLHVLQL